MQLSTDNTLVVAVDGTTTFTTKSLSTAELITSQLSTPTMQVLEESMLFTQSDNAAAMPLLTPIVIVKAVLLAAPPAPLRLPAKAVSMAITSTQRALCA